MIPSILNSVKKVLGLDPSYTAFDEDVLMHINSVFSTLTQLGVGPTNGFYIEDSNAEWSDFIGNDPRFSMVKSYMVLRVRLLFDPPATSYAIESMQKQISELEWRINVEREFQTHPYEPPIPDEGYSVWTLSVGDAWPPEAVPGDLGFDPTTGDVWRFV